MWTFVYKEAAINTSIVARPEYHLDFTVPWGSSDILSGSWYKLPFRWCGMFVAMERHAHLLGQVSIWNLKSESYRKVAVKIWQLSLHLDPIMGSMIRGWDALINLCPFFTGQCFSNNYGAHGVFQKNKKFLSATETHTVCPILRLLTHCTMLLVVACTTPVKLTGMLCQFYITCVFLLDLYITLSAYDQAELHA